MRILITALVIASAGLIGAASTKAMPVATAHQDEAAAVIKVMDGCGPNGHRGPYGHCRPRYNCPPGWHPGPYGWRCFRNW
jgi:hypothetical protein